MKTGKIETFDELVVKQQATIATPDAGDNAIYPKSDDLWYSKNSAGVEVAIGAGAYSLSVDDGGTPVTGVDDITFSGASVTDDTGGAITVTVDPLAINDGVTTVSSVDSITFSGASITDDTNGDITVTIPPLAVNDGTTTVSAVDNITFSGASVTDDTNGDITVTVPSLSVDDGSTTVTSVDNITFSGATVTDDTGGDVTVTIPAALSVDDGTTTVTAVDSLTFSGATVTDDGSGDATITIPAALTVTDGSTSVDSVDTISFSGAIVGDAGGGDVVVTITGGGGGEANTASNVGTGTGVFKIKNGIDLEFKRLNSSDSSVTFTGGTDDISVVLADTIPGTKTFSNFAITPSSAPTLDYQIANKKYIDDNAGEINTASNVGTGADVFKQKTGVDLEFKKLNSSDSSITFTGGTDDISAVLADTVPGTKTFSNFPVTPSSAPTTDYQAANKKYVDDATTVAAPTALATSGAVVISTTANDVYTMAAPSASTTLNVTSAAFPQYGSVINVIVTNPGTNLTINAAITWPNVDGGTQPDLPAAAQADILFKYYPDTTIAAYLLGEV